MQVTPVRMAVFVMTWSTALPVHVQPAGLVSRAEQVSNILDITTTLLFWYQYRKYL